jgi:hypothetical protein
MRAKLRTTGRAGPAPVPDPGPGVLLSLKEVAALCDLPTKVVGEWVLAGVIEPQVKGGKGRGRAAKFSVGQAYGLLTITGLAGTDVGRTPDSIWRVLYRKWAATPWPALEQLLGVRKDPWTEEELAKAMGPRRDPFSVLPEDEALLLALFRRFVRFRNVVRVKLGLGPERCAPLEAMGFEPPAMGGEVNRAPGRMGARARKRAKRAR